MAEKVSMKEKAQDASFNEAPQAMSKATLIGAIGAIVFLIIAAFLLWSFYQNSAGGDNSNTQTNVNRANP